MFKKGYKHTEEWKQMMRERFLGSNNPFHGKSHSEETRLKISNAKKGKKHSPLTIEKLKGRKAWNKGLKGSVKANSGSFKKGNTPWDKGMVREEMKGEKNHEWKGDEVGYFGLHAWIRKNLGTPDTCEFCLKSGLTKHKIHWANKSGKYLRDAIDWIRLCASCHKKYDLHRV